MASELKTYRTTKDNLAVYYKSYCFRKGHTLVSGDISWRCCTAGCLATITTSSKIDCVKHYIDNHKQHEKHQTPDNLSSPKMKRLFSNIKKPSNRASLDSVLGSLRRPVCFDSVSQTDETVLKSKDELINKMQQLTENQSALVQEIQDLTLQLQDRNVTKSPSSASLVNTAINTEPLVNPCEICCNKDEINRSLKEENDSLSNKISHMSVSIEALEADNVALRGELLTCRNEADKWRSLYDNMCARYNKFNVTATGDGNKEKMASCAVGISDSAPTACKLALNSKRRINTGGRIKLFADSQGRRMDELIAEKTIDKVTSTLKPGARLCSVMAECDNDCKSMTARDLIVLFGGTNDFSADCHANYLATIEAQLEKLTHTRVFLVNVPCRYDLSLSAPINDAISDANEKLKKIVSRFNNVKLFNVHGLGRRFYTRHGLHINFIGKRIIADCILRYRKSYLDVEPHGGSTNTDCSAHSTSLPVAVDSTPSDSEVVGSPVNCLLEDTRSGGSNISAADLNL